MKIARGTWCIARRIPYQKTYSVEVLSRWDGRGLDWKLNDTRGVTIRVAGHTIRMDAEHFRKLTAESPE